MNRLSPQKTIGNRTLTLILGALLMFSIIAAALVDVSYDSTPRTAVIYQDGTQIRRIDLNALSKEISFVVSCEEGSNTVTAGRGWICISEADCPDSVCIKQGRRYGGLTPIVCLPHRLVINFEENDSTTNDLPDVISG